MAKEPYLAHSELTHEIYIVSGRNKYLVTDQAVKAVKAIQALSQEPTEKPMTVDEMEREYEKSKALFHKIVECDDAISREDVIHYLECHKDEIHSDVLTFVKHLPSVSTTKNIVNHGTMNITL